MKKINKTIIAIILVIGIGGVISYFAYAESKDTPAGAITAFYDLAKHGEVDQAKKFVASETLKIYEHPTWLTGTLSQGMDREAKEYKKIEPKEETTEFIGQLATIDVTVTYPDGSKEIKPYKLIKEEGSWKIIFE